MARQQAFSCWVIATPVMHARTGAAAVSRRRMATILVRRRIGNLIIVKAVYLSLIA
jgi:hypothetical protein